MSLLYRGIFLFFFLLTITPGLVKAQDWEYGVSIGTSGYMGEYNQDNIFKFNSLAGSIGAKYNFNPTWGVRGGFAVVGINGNGRHLKDPALVDSTFRKTLKELSVSTEFNFFKFEPNKTKNAYTPYVFAGIGARLDDIGSQNTLRRAIVPFGAGFKYNLKGALSIDAQLSYRITADDKLDNYASPLPTKTDESTNESKIRLIDRATNTDSYMSFQIGITYTFFKQGCPTW